MTSNIPRAMSAKSSWPTPVRRSKPGPTLIVGDDFSVAVYRPGALDRLLTRLQAHRLEIRLAAGLPAEHDRRVALRAVQLVTPASRESVAHDWEQMLDRARSPRRPTDPGAPLARAPIIAAQQQILELVAALRKHRPVPARGVAMAKLLLTDGSGPLYSRRSRVELSTALLETKGQLDAANALTVQSTGRKGPGR